MHLKKKKWRLLMVLAGLYLAQIACAWYPLPGYQSPPPYSAAGPWPYYGNHGYMPGYRGYVQPRIYVRGHLNRYGDYWINFRVRGLSAQDMYMAWLWYNSLQRY